MNMCLWCVSQISELSGLRVSLIYVASHLHAAFELSHFFLQHDESYVIAFCFPIFLGLLFSCIAAQIFAPACRYASVFILHAVRNAASA